MPFLVAVSLMWAFSFGLTKTMLRGMDGTTISVIRLALALLVFLPFLRWRGLSGGTAAMLAFIGAIQFGLMYLALNHSYPHLAAHEIVLFTVTTPIFVTLFADALDRTWRRQAFAAALLAVAGTAVTVAKSANIASAVTGIALMQASNLAFAIGQVLYKRLRAQQPALRDREVFALLYAGGLAIAVFAALIRGGWTTPTGAQLWTLIYLGAIASGLGFFLWNVGATRVSAGTLAVMNNAKIPLGIACSLLFFHEQADVPRLLLGGALLAASVWLAQTSAKRRPSPDPGKN